MVWDLVLLWSAWAKYFALSANWPMEQPNTSCWTCCPIWSRLSSRFPFSTTHVIHKASTMNQLFPMFSAAYAHNYIMALVTLLEANKSGYPFPATCIYHDLKFDRDVGMITIGASSLLHKSCCASSQSEH